MPRQTKVTEQQVIDQMKNGGEFSFEMLGEKLHASTIILHRIMKILVTDGMVKESMHGKRKYFVIANEFYVCKPEVAGSRVNTWKELGIYDMKSHMRMCEDSRKLENGGLV